MAAISKIVRPIAHELSLFMAFSWRDWSTTIISGTLFSLGAMKSSQVPLVTALRRYIRLTLWLTSYIYFFALSNQIVGVDEDSINKPDRPIPSGKITLRGAKIRWITALSVFLIVSAFNKPMTLAEAICWIFTTAFLSLTSTGNHWLGKNLVGMTAGTWAQLSASWKAVAETSAVGARERYLYAVSLWCGLIIIVQDLRDIKGDTAVGRKTLPIVLGETRSRFMMAFVFMPASIAVLWLGGVVSLELYSLTAVHALLGWRITQVGRGSRYDHKTYMIFTYTYCLILAIISFIA